MEIALFGIEQGPNGQRVTGALEEAHGGTIYLDEVADMPKETQSKILRVLVDQNFQRVGGSTRVHVDVRVISSSARDLAADIAEGRFREDLYHRLSVVPLRVPFALGAARGHSRSHRLLHGTDLRDGRIAETRHGGGRARHPAIA